MPRRQCICVFPETLASGLTKIQELPLPPVSLTIVFPSFSFPFLTQANNNNRFQPSSFFPGPIGSVCAQSHDFNSCSPALILDYRNKDKIKSEWGLAPIPFVIFFSKFVASTKAPCIFPGVNYMVRNICIIVQMP